jgi:hypothetical protein
VSDPRDIVEIGGRRLSPGKGHSNSPVASTGSRRKFLSVWYRCCNVYGRMYRNRAQTVYEGKCPRCGAAVKARIGAQGTNRRTFEAG